MRNIIISTSCMGKTKLCKEFRDPEWRQSKSVDLDYKGVTTYSDEVRSANSMLASALLSSNCDIVTGFAGQFNYRQLLIDRVSITFALPIGRLLDRIPERSFKRNDSVQFTTLLREGRFRFAHRIWTDYLECKQAWRELLTEARNDGYKVEEEELAELCPVLVYSSSTNAYISDFVTLTEDKHLDISIDDQVWHPFRGNHEEYTAINALKALAEGFYYEL